MTPQQRRRSHFFNEGSSYGVKYVFFFVRRGLLRIDRVDTWYPPQGNMDDVILKNTAVSCPQKRIRRRFPAQQEALITFTCLFRDRDGCLTLLTITIQYVAFIIKKIIQMNGRNPVSLLYDVIDVNANSFGAHQPFV